jgi:uncharacterized membrane protein
MNVTTLFALVTLAVSGVLVLLTPTFSPRRYYFGVTVAPDFPRSEAGRAIRLVYVLAVLAALIAALAILLAFPRAALPAVMFPVPLTACAAFFYAHSRVQRFAAPAGAIREAEISLGPDRLPRWTLLVLPPFAFLAAVGLYLREHWDEIPLRFPVHFGLDGQPNRWASRTPHGVFGLLEFGAMILLLLTFIGIVSFYGSRRSPMREAVLRVLVAMTYLIAFIFGMVGLTPVFHFPPYTFLLPLPVFVAVILIYSYRLSSDPGIPVDPTPDDCWHFSTVYYNPEDPALFVQRRIGIGYTLNMGNPYAWWIGAAILITILVGYFLLR